jgi:hypothetical protein
VYAVVDLVVASVDPFRCLGTRPSLDDWPDVKTAAAAAKRADFYICEVEAQRPRSGRL